MTELIDPRLERLVSIDGTAHRGRLVIAVQTGGPDSVLNSTVRNLARVASRFRTTASEVRRAGNMLDSERGARIAEATGPLVQGLKDASRAYAAEHARIQKLAQTASAVPTYDESPPSHWTVADDHALMARFERMAPVDQKILIHHCTHDAANGYLRWAQALLRTPPELSGITQEEHDAMRKGALKALNPELFDRVTNELEQAEQAQRALQLAQQVLGEEAPGTLTELRISSPELNVALAVAE